MRLHIRLKPYTTHSQSKNTMLCMFSSMHQVYLPYYINPRSIAHVYISDFLHIAHSFILYLYILYVNLRNIHMYIITGTSAYCTFIYCRFIYTKIELTVYSILFYSLFVLFIVDAIYIYIYITFTFVLLLFYTVLLCQYEFLPRGFNKDTSYLILSDLI